MTQALPLIPFVLLLIVLPFPGTVAVRLLLLAIAFGVAFWHWWRFPGCRHVIPCKLALGTWIALSVASLGYAFDAGYSFGELKNELGYTMMAFFAFFTIAGERRRAHWLLWSAVAGLLVIGVIAIGTWVAHGGVWQERGIQGGTGVFGTYLVTVLPAVAWLIMEVNSQYERRIAVASGALVLFLAVIVAQRAVWPVLVVQIGLMLILAVRHGRLRISRFGVAAAIVAVVAIAVAGILYSHHARFGSPALGADVRLPFWPTVIAAIAEHPLAGAGFGRSVMHKASPDLIPVDAPALWHAHNVFLNYGLQLGVPGVLVLAFVFAAFAAMFWRATATNRSAAGVAGLMLVSGVVLRNQFNDFFLRDMSLMFWALTGVFARMARADEEVAEERVVMKQQDNDERGCQS